jgi:multidrug efflux system membrane fusion protein
VEFALAEKMLPEIRHQSRAGLPLSVEVRKSNQGTLMKGTVVFIDNQVDSNTGTITLRAEFPNADLAIWPGEFFEVRLTLGIDTGVVVIPLSALGQSVGGAQTYVLDKDNRVSRRKLKVRRVDRELVLLDGGLEPGETVITDGVVRLADGLAVRVLPPAGEASP